MSRAPRISVTIDRLVLRGFAPAQRDAIANALQAELGRQLAESGRAGLLTDSRATPALRAGTIGPQSSWRGVGARAAGQILTALGAPRTGMKRP
jgi:hypothetical protein